MSPDETKSGPVTVVKLGGSVLTSPGAYRRAARFFRRRLDEEPQGRFVVVVSAEQGHTDALLQAAQRIVQRPNPVMLDLLWSTGELRSVALLTLALHAAGVRATGLNVEQTGLLVRQKSSGERSVTLEAGGLRRALERYRVAVAPGFLARRGSGAVVTLGRGGSDWTAVLLAAGLGADRCELIKDVPGYFSDDPRTDPHARHIPALTNDVAVAMARAGCDLVQQQALEEAARRGVTLVIRSLDEPVLQTEVRHIQLDHADAANHPDGLGAAEPMSTGFSASHVPEDPLRGIPPT